ncbi:MAG: amidase [Gemmatimonadota bacterium]
MKRRTFLGSGLAAGALGTLRPRDLLGSPPARQTHAPGHPLTPPDFELEEATIADLQQGMESGQHTARSLTEAYLARIAELDRDGPALRALLETNPDALEVADELDAERRSGRIRGALHGIPVLLKDNIETADRMETTAGSLALLGARPGRDAFAAGRLREAGAVILGKANLSEWANFRSTASSSGWSARGGQAKNPYALDRTPCGSSSGSGTAVAANLCAVAVGTETDGSIVCPSSANSIVGIKPTLGRVSRSGIVPLAHSQDTAGPMARTVADAAILLGAMAGADPADPGTAENDRGPQDYTRFLDPRGLEGARIGIPRERFFGYSEETDRIAETAIEALREAGAVLVDPATLPHAGEYEDSEYEVLLYDFKADVNAYLAGRPGAPVRTLADLIRFNEERRDEEMPFFGQEIFVQAEEKGPLSEAAYLEALEKNHRLSRAEGIDQVMNEHRLDALFAPTTSPPWTIDLVNGDHGLGGCSTPAAVAGYPHVTVPAGYAFGLPVGASFFGRAWSEPVLIRLAYAFEQVMKARRPPRFAATAELEAP